MSPHQSVRPTVSLIDHKLRVVVSTLAFFGLSFVLGYAQAAGA